jgi:hypothetical protein
MKSVQAIKDAKEYEEVFRQYLEICNRAIEQNRNKFPYTEIWGARFKSREEAIEIQAVVFDDRPKVAYTLRLTEHMKIEIAEKKTTRAGRHMALYLPVSQACGG